MENNVMEQVANDVMENATQVIEAVPTRGFDFKKFGIAAGVVAVGAACIYGAKKLYDKKFKKNEGDEPNLVVIPMSEGSSFSDCGNERDPESDDFEE